MINPVAHPQSPELVEQLAGAVQLTDIRLASSMTRCSADLGNLPTETRQTISTQHAYAEADRRLTVTAQFELNIAHDADATPPIAIHAAFVLVYRIKDGCPVTPQHCSDFANTNAVFNAWPYWREFVQSMTVRMGLPALTLPVFRVTRKAAPETPAPGSAHPAPPRTKKHKA